MTKLFFAMLALAATCADAGVVLSTVPPAESDPLAYPVATNALALASTALQPPATNGWTTSSHDGLATWQGATNAAVAVAWIAPDIASNVVYHVVVSNGHWLIREGN